MSDTIPESLFEQLRNRTPTDDDRRRLLAVKASMGLSDRDEMWPVIITLDHYAAANQSARKVIVEALKELPDDMKQAMKNVEQAAGVEAKKAITDVVEEAANRLSQIVVKRTQTTADNVSQRDKILTMCVGATIGLGFIVVGAALAFFVLKAGGICTEAPVVAVNGDTVCVIERIEG